MANPVLMGDAASQARSVEDAPTRAAFVPERPEITPQPTQELVEIDVPDGPVLARVDLTDPQTAIREGLADLTMTADFPLEPAPRGPLYAPTGPVIADRFDPREWTLIKGNWLSTPDPLVGRAPEATTVATIGGILKDGFGRRVRSGTGSWVRTGRYGRE